MDLIRFLEILLIVAGVACVIHLLRNGRSWLWLIALILVPFVGVIAYFLFEVLPDLRGRGRPREGVIDLRDSDAHAPSIKEAERALQDSPTVDNRSQLARACLRRGQAERAVALYEECLEGVYRDDLTLWYELAEAAHANQQPEKTLEALDRLEEGEYHDYRRRRQLLRALALDRLGRQEEARDLLAVIVDGYPSVQARYEYARVLLDLGEKEEARREVEYIFAQRSRHDRRYRQREASWYKAAEKLPVK